MKNQKILVTGGTGMVGKALQSILPDAAYIGSRPHDLTSNLDTMIMYHDHKPDTVIHLAALVGGIQHNMAYPASFFDKNILMNTHVLMGAKELEVKNFIGVLSTCIYPDVLADDYYPLKENVLHEGPPTPTNFSYGYAKRCMAVQIDAYNKQYGTTYNYIIPCNIYGPNDKFSWDHSHYVAALIRKIYEAVRDNKESILLFGSGKPLRQFIYEADVARILKLMVENDIRENINVAPDEVYSIDEIARIALKACGADHLKINYDTTKPDGQYRKDCCNKKLKTIFPDFVFTSLEEGIRKTFEAYKQKAHLWEQSFVR